MIRSIRSWAPGLRATALLVAVLLTGVGAGRRTPGLEISDPHFERRGQRVWLVGRPFTGIAEWHERGALVRRTTYHDGQREGPEWRWWPDGTPRMTCTFHHDEFDGVLRTWHKDGQPASERHYAMGHETGRQHTWTTTGETAGNYVVIDGRNYGLQGTKLCVRR
jgi:hypothetical protein